MSFGLQEKQRCTTFIVSLYGGG